MFFIKNKVVFVKKNLKYEKTFVVISDKVNKQIKFFYLYCKFYNYVI